MIQKLFRKVKQNRGFTMMEMLVVVGVTVVLLGISTFGITGLVSTLKMTELDSYAKTIFMDAQYQMSAREVEGAKAEFYEKVLGGHSTRFLTAKPHDYDANDNTTWQQLCYFTKADEITKEVVYSDADMYNGNYIIEMNPQTGDIYGVFYWEAEEGQVLTVADFETYYAETIVGLADRTLASRKEIKVGYYGGDYKPTTMATDFDLGQKVEIINDEELYVKVSYRKDSTLITNFADMKIEFEIQDEHGNTWTYAYGKDAEEDLDKTARTPLYINEANLEVYLLLDSIPMSFEQLYGDDVYGEEGLVPGDDLTVDVTSTFKYAGYFGYANEIQNTNSLFGYDPNGDIVVSSLRHLRNLGEDIYKEVPAGELVIVQTDDIDFTTTDFAWVKNDVMNYMEYAGLGNADNRPDGLNYWTPLRNEAVFTDNSAAESTIFNGGGYKLKNFKVASGSSAVGLIAESNYVNYSRVCLEDAYVVTEGKNNVGTLAGTISNAKVNDCGAYLTTYYYNEAGEKKYYAQTEGAAGVSNQMAERYATLKVAGTGNVGGLFGEASNSNIVNSFAAVQIYGQTNIGGLVGNAKNLTMENCYASGDVYGYEGSQNIGGFIGKASAVNVKNAYASGIVNGAAYVGGFLGDSAGSSYTDCISYGEVTKYNADYVGKTDVGGFISQAGNASGNTINSCYYLSQKGYNIKSDLSDNPTGVGAIGYTQANDFAKANGKVLSISASHSYDVTLLNQAFPFAKVLDHHYGNWPAQYNIDTAVVYYERYADGTYGYYSVTQLTDRKGQQTDGNIWVLDTLLSGVECVEDGYAILSMYNLKEFTYQLDIGADGAAVSTPKRITIAENASTNTAVVLRQQGPLVFKAYNKDSVSEIIKNTAETYQEFAYSTSNVEISEYIEVTGMYLYQLPYELQNTNRSGVSSFYDKLTITEAKALGYDGSVINNFAVHYCPLFAKSVINPGLDTAGQFVNATTILNPSKAFIRSARHLNGLGRFPYFWNDKKGMAEGITYVQELDVNFGTYTTTYCGQEFNMGIGGNVANQPIGVAAYAETNEQFRNNYDGMCNKIIDYTLSSSEQFTGLFGEIRDAEIRNVVMTVSKPGAGKITSTYWDDDNSGILGIDFNMKRVGVGALIGLDYAGENVIDNCVASGYQVEFVLNPVPSSRFRLPSGVAVGGLVGIGMSPITNCAADNDVQFVANCNYTNSDGAVMLGGFAGSYFYNRITDAYCGGTIDIKNDNNYVLYRVRIGGFCPGFLETYTPDGFDEPDSVSYVNIYTYTDVSDSVWNIGLNTTNTQDDDFKYLIPAVGRLKISYSYLGGWSTTCSTETSLSPAEGIQYYLKSEFDPHLEKMEEKDTDAWHYFTKASCGFLGLSEHGKTCDGVDYLTLLKIDPRMPNRVASNATYPNAPELQGKTYPFPAVITNANGEYVHYGDWPDMNYTEEVISDANYATYFEVYDSGEVGLYGFGKNGTAYQAAIVGGNLTVDPQVVAEVYNKNIVRTGYGQLTVMENVQAPSGSLVTTTKVQKSEDPNHFYTYYLYEEDLGEEFVFYEAKAFKEVNLAYEVIGEGITKEMVVNEAFAAAISVENEQGEMITYGTLENPYQVRTQQQFMNVSSAEGENLVFLQSHDIPLTNSFSSVTLKSTYLYSGGTNKFTGATKPIFNTNNGTIISCTVENADVSGLSNAAGFVVNNAGVISACSVSGDVNGSSRAAGFVYANTGIIENCVANCDVSAGNFLSSGSVAGFAYTSQTAQGGITARIENCVFSGSVDAWWGGEYNFIANNDYATVVNCIANGTAVGTQTYSTFGLLENVENTEESSELSTEETTEEESEETTEESSEESTEEESSETSSEESSEESTEEESSESSSEESSEESTEKETTEEESSEASSEESSEESTEEEITEEESSESSSEESTEFDTEEVTELSSEESTEPEVENPLSEATEPETVVEEEQDETNE